MPYKDPIKQKEAQQKWYLKNKGNVSTQHLAKADEIKAYKKEYRKTHRPEINEYTQEYLDSHPEIRQHRNEYDRQYRKSNKPRLTEYRGNYYAKTGK